MDKGCFRFLVRQPLHWALVRARAFQCASAYKCCFSMTNCSKGDSYVWIPKLANTNKRVVFQRQALIEPLQFKFGSKRKKEVQNGWFTTCHETALQRYAVSILWMV